MKASSYQKRVDSKKETDKPVKDAVDTGKSKTGISSHKQIIQYTNGPDMDAFGGGSRAPRFSGKELALSRLNEIRQLTASLRPLQSRMIRRDELIELVRRYIGVYSGSKMEQAMAEMLMADVKEFVRSNPVRIFQSDTGNVIIDILGENQALRPLILTAHMDTLKKSEPGALEVDLENNLMYCTRPDVSVGFDDKNGLALIMAAVRALSATRPFRRTLRLIFTVAEEIGMAGACELVENENCRPMMEEAVLIILFDGPIFKEDKPVEHIFSNFRNIKQHRALTDIIFDAAQEITGNLPLVHTFTLAEDNVYKSRLPDSPVLKFQAGYSGDAFGHANDYTYIPYLEYIAEDIARIITILDSTADAEIALAQPTPVVRKEKYFKET